MSLINDRELFKEKKSDIELSQIMFIIIATRKTQIKTALRFHLTPLRINKTKDNKCWKRKGVLITVDGIANWSSYS